MSAEEAFNHLKEIAEKEQDKARKTASDCMARSDYEQAQMALGRAKKIQEALKDLERLKARWFVIAAGGAPQLELVAEEAVHAGRARHAAKPDGQRMPEEAFRIPILQALVELGGRGRRRDVVAQVEKNLAALTDFDRGTLPDGKTVRWKNTLYWARFELAQEGYLSAGTPRGVWEITTAGRAYLGRNK